MNNYLKITDEILDLMERKGFTTNQPIDIQELRELIGNIILKNMEAKDARIT